MVGITKEVVKKDFETIHEMLNKYQDAIWESQTPNPAHYDRQSKLVRLAIGDVRSGLLIVHQALNMLSDKDSH